MDDSIAIGNDVRAELRRSYPGKAKAADHSGGRAAAIRLHCLECQGGSRQGVHDCEVETCFLWPFRGSGNRRRLNGRVPSLAEYEELAENRGNPDFRSKGDSE